MDERPHAADSLSRPVEAPSLEKPGGGFFSHLLGLYTTPREGFAALLTRPRWWWPLLAGLAVTLVFLTVWLQKVDPHQIAQLQIEQSPFADRMSAEDRAAAIERGARFLKPQALIGAVVGYPIFVLALGGLFLFVYRFFFGSRVRFAQSLAVVAWSFLVVSLVSTPLTLGVLALKGDWNVDPRHAVQANLSLLLDQDTTAAPLYTLAQQLDLFTAWTLFLLAAGYGVACRRPTSAAAWGVLGPWMLWVVLVVGLSAVF